MDLQHVRDGRPADCFDQFASDRRIPAGAGLSARPLAQKLSYDHPFTKRERAKLHKGRRLNRERMDFLLMMPGNIRIVIEADGKQHYAKGDVAAPQS